MIWSKLNRRRIFIPVAGVMCACFLLAWLLIPELIKNKKTSVILPGRVVTPAEGLLQAAAAGDMVNLGFYLGKYSSFDGNDSVGRKALMAAAENGHADAAALLLTAGVKPVYNDSLGQFPLGAAAVAGHVEVMRILLRYHADVNQGYMQENTALIQACRNNRPAAVEFLLRNKAALWPGQGSGRSALITALHSGHEDIVWQLLNAGADCNDSDQDGNSVLMLAIKINSESLVGWLLKNNKFDRTHVNKHGENIGIVAQKTGDQRLINLLKTVE